MLVFFCVYVLVCLIYNQENKMTIQDHIARTWQKWVLEPRIPD